MLLNIFLGFSIILELLTRKTLYARSYVKFLFLLKVSKSVLTKRVVRRVHVVHIACQLFSSGSDELLLVTRIGGNSLSCRIQKKNITTLASDRLK